MYDKDCEENKFAIAVSPCFVLWLNLNVERYLRQIFSLQILQKMNRPLKRRDFVFYFVQLLALGFVNLRSCALPSPLNQPATCMCKPD